QGVGGAAMFATSLALIAQEFDGPERGTAIAAWGATIGGAVAIGPLVGGALTEGLSWEWIFFVNVPIGIATVLLAESQAGESHSRPVRADRRGGADRLRRLLQRDPPGRFGDPLRRIARGLGAGPPARLRRRARAITA
ncbi:MAG: MFS transporter, partial [Solirubrobacterales bacterium]